jgi:hypothetical protein
MKLDERKDEKGCDQQVAYISPVLCLSMMLPVPRSPEDENLMPSFVTAMLHVSPRTPKSVLIIELNRSYKQVLLREAMDI